MHFLFDPGSSGIVGSRSGETSPCLLKFTDTLSKIFLEMLSLRVSLPQLVPLPNTPQACHHTRCLLLPLLLVLHL
jgi:hypothetical protein